MFYPEPAQLAQGMCSAAYNNTFLEMGSGAQ